MVGIIVVSDAHLYRSVERGWVSNVASLSQVEGE